MRARRGPLHEPCLIFASACPRMEHSWSRTSTLKPDFRESEPPTTRCCEPTLQRRINKDFKKSRNVIMRKSSLRRKRSDAPCVEMVLHVDDLSSTSGKRKYDKSKLCVKCKERPGNIVARHTVYCRCVPLITCGTAGQLILYLESASSPS
jgi:hypothetical protein